VSRQKIRLIIEEKTTRVRLMYSYVYNHIHTNHIYVTVTFTNEIGETSIHNSRYVQERKKKIVVAVVVNVMNIILIRKSFEIVFNE
jgi:hypothetical protein